MILGLPARIASELDTKEGKVETNALPVVVKDNIGVSMSGGMKPNKQQSSGARAPKEWITKDTKITKLKNSNHEK